MSIFDGLHNDDVYLQKPDGQQFGPFKTKFNNKSISIMDDSLDADEGDKIVFTLPNGKVEYFTVTEVKFSSGMRGGIGGIPSRYILTLQKDSALRPRAQSTTTNHINISGSQGIQIGDHNSQHFQMMFSELLNKIDQADGSPEEKEEAKKLLTKLLEHPLVSSVVGAALPTVLGLFN
ncbi:hypothetical protein WP8S17C03_30470 [Metapseudomonas otitidis]|uniref:Uncharacterized protein n=1 Tax=Metapseudomonas otitidis TaxID=319939 RepID=A0A6S5RNI4_9GAMM|nr:RIP homotypic interaction motif-containing protein [Pseudomonas otitidis]BBT16998.1 hypothetical protein WP8S17C03_30470 [Pseudomonas otitidis]